MLRIRTSRLVAMIIAVTSAFLLVAAPIQGAVETVTGTVTMRARIALSPNAVAVITLANRSPSGAGTIIGQQRINGATTMPLPFSVPFERNQINNNQAYAIYASIVDGSREWQSTVPVPTITGGPTQGLTVEVVEPSYGSPAQVTGTIAVPQNAQLTDQAVAYAAIFNADSGRMVVRQTITAPGRSPIAFSISYDADLVDPEATYVAAAAVIDGARLWQTSAATPVTPDAVLALSVVRRDVDIPAEPTPAPSETPTEEPTAEPTAEPTGAPTDRPTTGPTEAPTATPTEAPTATPTEAPTATPTEAPTATPTEAPTASPSPSPSASPTPTASSSAEPTVTPVPTSVSGTLVYRERAALSDSAVATIAIVQMLGDGATLTVVGGERINNPGQVPIAFDVPLDSELFNPDVEAQLWATIIDGDRAWVTADGVLVASAGAPAAGVVVNLTFRPDLLEGEVSGVIAGAGTGLSTDAFYMTWVIDSSGNVLGVDNERADGADPIPFSVPFQLADIDTGAVYVASAYVKDGENVWVTQSGTAVITGGNPYAGVQLNVTQALPTPSPSPSPTATASPAPTATPAPAPPASSGGLDPIWLLVLALAAVGLVGVIVVMRR